ncbi:MAG: TetR/AcrR family transcriptional regulator [Rhodospirillales bacterium]|nr:TetR/AcrR family transcriptional regulator [Rhodospirillales bacterium]QQS11006.1 MAG: TetR/AcrR family transcriptional regulator [Rhodospirillales bacterium]
MNKSEDRRAAIVDRLADFVLAEGLSASSLRPLADAAGTSDRMLLYYFKDKTEIVAAALERISQRLVAVLDAAAAPAPLPFDRLLPRLRRILLADAMRPYMRLWLEVAALAARGDPFHRAIGERLGRGFLAWGAAQLDSATPRQRAADAARLFVMLEGMVLLNSLGLGDVCDAALPPRRRS